MDKAFIEEYNKIIERTIYLKDLVAKNGLLALDDVIDMEKVKNKDILEFGLRLLVDGRDEVIINKILSHLISQEKNTVRNMLKNIQRLAITDIYYSAFINPEYEKEKFTIVSKDKYMEIPGILEIREPVDTIDNNVDKVCFSGTIKNLSIKADKKGQKLAFATLVTDKNEIDLWFFSTIWEKYKTLIENGKKVAIKGEIESQYNRCSCLVREVSYE